MQEIMGAMRRAIQHYTMVAPGDKIAVGLSGGKDSIALLEGLYLLQPYIGIPFDLMAITIDPCFHGQYSDFSQLTDFCAQREIPYVVYRSDIAEIVFDIRKETNPCSLCAKMRRGILHDIVKEHGFNKLALGHHQDDAVETVMMNLFRGGRFECFQPVTYLSRKDLTMIRPLIFLEERTVIGAVRRAGLPVIPSGCEMDGATAREETKQLLYQLEKTQFPTLRKNIFGALCRSGQSGWKE